MIAAATTRIRQLRPVVRSLQQYHRSYLHDVVQPPNFPQHVPKKIVFGSCSDSSEDLTYWYTFCSLEPDLVILMGDNVYGKRSTLSQEYEKLKEHTSFQRAQSELCILATVDDNDMSDGTSTIEQDEAIRLFKETFSPSVASEDGVYQVYEWQDQLQIILLDLRCFASPMLLPANEPGALREQNDVSGYNDETTIMLGEAQWKWLEEQLQKDFQQRLVVSPLQVLSLGHHGFECWHKFPHERKRLLQLLEEKSALLLTGDRHVSALYASCQDDDGYQNCVRQYEITSSSLTHSVPPGLLDSEVDPLRVSDFCYQNNFGMLELFGEESMVDATIRCAKSGEILQRWQLPIS